MKQITEAEMLACPADVLNWVEAGECVEISRDGVAVARLVPEKKPVVDETSGSHKVDWSTSAAFTADRTGEHVFTHEEVMSLLGRL